MKVFEVKLDDSLHAIGVDYYLDCCHKWFLPGVRCHTCGATWSTTGIAYAHIDLSGTDFAADLSVSRPVEVAEMQRLRDLLIPFLPSGSPLPPGSEFGPLVGNLTGTAPDFVCPNPWTVVLRTGGLDQLVRGGLTRLTHVPAIIGSKERQVELAELVAVPTCRLTLDTLSKCAKQKCQLCGRLPIQRPVEIVVDSDSIPAELEIFRLAQLPSIVLASERFAEAVQSCGLTGLTFHPVKVL